MVEKNGFRSQYRYKQTPLKFENKNWLRSFQKNILKYFRCRFHYTSPVPSQATLCLFCNVISLPILYRSYQITNTQHFRCRFCYISRSTLQRIDHQLWVRNPYEITGIKMSAIIFQVRDLATLWWWPAIRLRRTTSLIVIYWIVTHVSFEFIYVCVETHIYLIYECMFFDLVCIIIIALTIHRYCGNFCLWRVTISMSNKPDDVIHDRCINAPLRSWN